MAFTLFNVDHQLTFYGAYHSNRTNVLIHIVCVPLLIWSMEVILASAPVPSFFPAVHYSISDYLRFDFDWPAVGAAVYLAYYYALEPLAALLYTPQWILSLLTAQAFARDPSHINQAAILHGVCWIAQFLGHGLAEKRAPALLDNLLGAVVLAPFFVHLELLFAAGYKPAMHKRIQNSIGKEIAKLRKAQGDKQRASKEL